MRYRFTLIAMSCAALAACETPKHSNTLIFGTNTKVAFDVSADAVTQTPSITLGYTRQEAVWMPLMPNVDRNGKMVPCGNEETRAASEACKKFIGKDGATKTEGAKEDTYSVLATFGATFSGGANTQGGGSENPEVGGAGAEVSAGTTASAGIAQYFATGLAARILAKEGGADLVAVQPQKYGFSPAEIEAIETEQENVIEEFLKWCAPGGTVDAGKCNTTAVDKADGMSTSARSKIKAAIAKPDLDRVEKLLDVFWSPEEIRKMMS